MQDKQRKVSLLKHGVKENYILVLLLEVVRTLESNWYLKNHVSSMLRIFGTLPDTKGRYKLYNFRIHFCETSLIEICVT